ncbi:MAG: NUDIX hydrolase [Muribaculaceae bacterium]|nr:NUDIX hydrolase [Muribaculaceae bacterium]MBQ7855469.1 NUDIX hydrolase [Muribaculaceae bacterium]
MKYCYKYWRPSVATDCVIFGFTGKQLKVLLIKRDVEPFKDCWALPGGFLRESDNTAEECALRELKEETGLILTNNRIWQLGVSSEADRDPRTRVISLSFIALVTPSEVKGGDDASDAQWFNLNEIPSLAFDHAKILENAKEALKQKIHFEPIGYDLLGEEFTIPQVQALYESIQGVTYDRRNFARKIQTSGFLIPLNKKASGTAHRPAHLFSCDKGLFRENARRLKFETKK